MTSTFVNAAKSPTNSYLQISSQSNSFKNISVGGAIHFNVKITEKLAKITYQVSASLITKVHDKEQFYGSFSFQVIARGVVVLTKDISINSDTAVISVNVTDKMTPKARLIAYGIRPKNHEILVDVIDFACDGLFRNKVK